MLYQAASTWAVFAARNAVLGIAAINVITLIKKYVIINYLTMTIKEGFSNLIDIISQLLYNVFIKAKI